MLKTIWRTLGSGVAWLRAGYPERSPTGHSALMALNGPSALTLRQRNCIAAQLEASTPDVVAVEVAITKVTHRLPTPAQTREMVHILQRRRASSN